MALRDEGGNDDETGRERFQVMKLSGRGLGTMDI